MICGFFTESPVGAVKLTKDLAGTLYPSQREGFLDKWRHVHPMIAEMTQQEIGLHGGGWFCWLLQNPRALVDPIPTGGKLNLWRFNVEPKRLVFREPEPPKPPEPPTEQKQPKRSPGRRKK